jgi:molybdenum cofactor cytidylyltransferase
MMDAAVHIYHPVVVVLAAGSSSRLGRPKQLLEFRGKTLLAHAVEAAMECAANEVVVILGANEPEVNKALPAGTFDVLVNDGWNEGMASSVRLALQHVQHKMPQADGMLIVVCDQPFVTAELFNQMLQEQHTTGLPIVACSYAARLGTPALFHLSYFELLAQLQGDTGARKILMEHKARVAVVPFEQGMNDIDTPEAYQRLLTTQGINQ